MRITAIEHKAILNPVRSEERDLISAGRQLTVCLFAIVPLTLSGCLTTKNVQQRHEMHLGPDDGIAVIGLSGSAKILFWRGDFRNGVFKPDGFFPRGLSLATGQPYLVETVRQTTDFRRYGFESITVGGKVFGADCHGQIPVLSVKPGTVQYLGDFAVVQQGGRWILSLENS
jgi:hypothetical protein